MLGKVVHLGANPRKHWERHGTVGREGKGVNEQVTVGAAGALSTGGLWETVLSMPQRSPFGGAGGKGAGVFIHHHPPSITG